MSKQQGFSFLRNWRGIEQTSYWVVWAVLAFLPLIFWDIRDPNQQLRLIGGWIRILPFFIIFLIHNYILLPRLLLRKHYLVYALVTLGLILLVNYWFIFSDFLHDTITSIIDKNRGNLQEGAGRVMEHSQRYRDLDGRPGHVHRGPGSKYLRWHGPGYIIYTYNVFISLLLVGFNTVLSFASQWLSQEQNRREAEKAAAESKLTALQNQISPHFFMNTLNNIHALIDYDTEDAKDAVLRLSKMMRYLLYESDHGKTTLRKEIEFMQSYIELMKLRLQPEVDLKATFPSSIPDVEIYSLLTISFLENAFKHGIDPKGTSHIHILLEVLEDKVHFNCRNSKSMEGDDQSEEGGIGIENARQRLELLYGNDYTLSIYDRPNEFEVDLTFPVV